MQSQHICSHPCSFVFRVSSSQTQQLNRCVQDCEGPSPCGGPKPEYEDAYIDVYACCASQPWVEECAATPGPTPPPKPTKPPSSSPTPRPSTMKPTGKPTEPQPTKVSPILINNAVLCAFNFLLFFHFLHLITLQNPIPLLLHKTPTHVPTMDCSVYKWHMSTMPGDPSNTCTNDEEYPKEWLDNAQFFLHDTIDGCCQVRGIIVTCKTK